MSTMLERMKARLKAKENSFTLDNIIFPHWKINTGQSATIRFLPWEDEVSGGFWTERKMLPMTFQDPEDESKQVFFRAPCREMYDVSQKCPVANLVRDVFKEANALKSEGNTSAHDSFIKIGGAHWIKLSAYFQGFINKPGMTEENVPDNPIRIFTLSKSLYKKISDSIKDDDDPFDRLPTGEFILEDVNKLMSGEVDDDDFLDRFIGYDYVIRKTKQGEYDNYDTSNWTKSESMLTDEQLEAIHEHGYHDLRARLPEQPTDEQYDVLVEMMKTSIEHAKGQHEGYWNPEWEEAGFKPFRPRSSGSNNSDETSSSAVSSSIRKNMNKSDNPESSSKGSVKDRLAARRGAGKKTETKEEISENVEEIESDEVSETPTEEETDNSTDKSKRISALAARVNKSVKTKS